MTNFLSLNKLLPWISYRVSHGFARKIKDGPATNSPGKNSIQGIRQYAHVMDLREVSISPPVETCTLLSWPHLGPSTARLTILVCPSFTFAYPAWFYGWRKPKSCRDHADIGSFAARRTSCPHRIWGFALRPMYPVQRGKRLIHHRIAARARACRLSRLPR